MLAAGEVAPGNRLATLPAWPWDILDDDAPRTLGWHAIAWAEGWSGFPGVPDGFPGLIQPNGPQSGKPFRFTQDQQTFLLWFYSLDDDAQWLFNYAVRRLAKGSGKSPFAAVLCLIEFLACVRLLTFRKGAPGGVEGKQVDMPLVQIAATAEVQTANTMRMVRAFASKKSPVTTFYELDPGKTQYYKMPEGTLQVITSSVTAAEGAEASFIVGDEGEHWIPSNSGDELAATLEDNLAKSGSRMMSTANAWVPGKESVAETDWDAWVAQEEGRLRGDSRVLYDARLAPPDTELDDPDSLQAALEFIYMDCDWKHPGGIRTETSVPDVRPIMERIWSPRAKPSESKRKYLNWPTVAEDAWTTPEKWARLVDTSRVVADGEDVVMFFDGSKSKDATALIGCCVSDGHVFTIGIWEPDPADPESVVPVAEVDAAVAKAFDDWNVRGFFGDVREWESFTKISWPEAYGDDLEVMAVPGGKDPQSIAWDMRSKVYEFTVECELVDAEIDDIGFTHDGDSRLARHVQNCRRRPNRYGVSVGKESPDSPNKIDAGVCVIGARMVRRRLLAVPEKKTKKPGRVRGFS